MRATSRAALLAGAWLLTVATDGRAEPHIDGRIEEEIGRVAAIDNHAHPLRVLAPGETDTEWDAITSGSMLIESTPFPLPVRLRQDNPEFIGAWRALFGYRHDDMAPGHLSELAAARRRVAEQQGDTYPSWVLDRLGIETMLANRVVLGRGLVSPRFRWVPYVDAFLYPFEDREAAARSPEAQVYHAGIARARQRLLADAGLGGLPATLPEYLESVVSPTFARFASEGAVAVKFEAAYLRGLDFAATSEFEARRIFARYVLGGEPTAAEHKALQDFLFRYLVAEAGRFGLAVHVHTGAGAGAYFSVSGADPALLEPALNDPALRSTRIVLVHGGWPFTDTVAALLAKPNVYADFSAQTFLLSPEALAGVLRRWLELYPEKVLFGTDAFALTPEVGWEDLAWLSTTSARRALGLALTAMLDDGRITRQDAIGTARLVLRENALRLYAPATPHLDAPRAP